MRGAGAVPGKGADSGSRGGGGAWPMKRRGPGRRAPPPAFKRETARCPSLGAPSADRATQCAARAVLSVPLTPRGARAALAAAAHRATRRERRPRRPAALTGERGDAGVCMCSQPALFLSLRESRVGAEDLGDSGSLGGKALKRPTAIKFLPVTSLWT